MSDKDLPRKTHMGGARDRFGCQGSLISAIGVSASGLTTPAPDLLLAFWTWVWNLVSRVSTGCRSVRSTLCKTIRTLLRCEPHRLSVPAHKGGLVSPAAI